ncbi:MAG: DUF2235 domain-containing protein [Campylobacterota bacterium]|nr:DUF2235 domain-containing protein [Campylobacterota bacterium]
MKRLVVCCDGTWSNAEQEDNGTSSPTNVVKIYNAITKMGADGVKQLKYYHPGVGGEGIGAINALLGGAVGMGISRHIRSAYHWLGNNYEEGDEIYLFGFSRGAFTVRSLGGMLSQGLLDLHYISSDFSWDRVKRAYKGYRIEGSTLDEWAEDEWVFFNQKRETPIHFIGVWETVGALGVPDDLEIFNIFDNEKKWKFHNVSLGDNIKHARHAMALDEIRSSFSVCRWDNAAGHDDAVELWFPGVHSDVGGGYSNCDLSNGALRWMMDESADVGLGFRDNILQTLKSDPLGVMHNSYRGALAKLRSRPRNIPAMISQNHDQFHESSIRRQELSPIEYPTYYPTRILDIGESVTVDVYADTRWNATDIYLPKDHSFTFLATGKWKDSKDVCNWNGTEDGILTIGDFARASSSFLGKFENIFEELTKNNSMDFLGTKRVENIKWFAMVGAIANDAGAVTHDAGTSSVVNHDGSPVPHQYVDLTKHNTTYLTIEYPGYLYCFPNDVWSLYGNNHGSVQLTITRKR